MVMMESSAPNHVLEQCRKMRQDVWMVVRYFIRQQGKAFTFYTIISTVLIVICRTKNTFEN